MKTEMFHIKFETLQEPFAFYQLVNNIIETFSKRNYCKIVEKNFINKNCVFRIETKNIDEFRDVVNSLTTDSYRLTITEEIKENSFFEKGVRRC